MSRRCRRSSGSSGLAEWKEVSAHTTDSDSDLLSLNTQLQNTATILFTLHLSYCLPETAISLPGFTSNEHIPNSDMETNSKPTAFTRIFS